MERNRLLQQLDKVCEEKDEQIKQLKQSMYEKQVEADNQLTLFKEEKKNLYDEIASLKGDMDQRLAVRESDVNKLSESKDMLGKRIHVCIELTPI